MDLIFVSSGTARYYGPAETGRSWGAREAMAASVLAASVVNAARLQLGRRARQFSAILAKDGYQGIVRRVRLKASDWIRPRSVVWSVFPEDVMAADLLHPPVTVVPKIAPGEPIVVNWVMEASGRGSGGHTTTCRIIKYMERRGICEPRLFV
jgi:hypothetical protein